MDGESVDQWCEAATRGDCEAVALLLKANPALLDHSHYGWVALHRATTRGHGELVVQLLAAGCDVNATNNEGETALHLAASKGYEMIVAALLAEPRVNVEVVDVLRRTALHHAVLPKFVGDDCGQGDKVKVVEMLLADGRVPPNAVDGEDLTALRIAVSAENDGAVALLLSQPSIQIDDEGRQILHLAIKQGNDEIFSHLLSKSSVSDVLAWVNKVVPPGWNAFHRTVGQGRDGMAARLLALSPSLIDGLNPYGDNALQIAINTNYKLVHKSIGTPCMFDNIVDMLLVSKPELIASIDSAGNTVLHLAANSNPPLSPQCFMTLWQSLVRDDVRAVNTAGQTPFSIAVRRNNDFALDLMKWKLSLQEMEESCAVSSPQLVQLRSKLRPAIEAESACLLHFLHRDVVGTVYEYLGFAHKTGAGHQQQNRRRPNGRGAVETSTPNSKNRQH